MCKQAEGRQKRREAGNLDPNDPEDILCSLVSLEPLAPACQKNSSYEYTGEYLEKKKKISHRTPLFSLWISECREREKTSKLSFYEQRQIWQKIKAQLESSEFVPGSPSVMSPVDIENPTCSGLTLKTVKDKKKHSFACRLSETQSKILLDYMCKQAKDRQKRREAGNLDPNDPQDILCSLVSLEPLAPACQKNSSYEYTGEYLEMEKKFSHRTPLFSLWISECREREKTSKLSFYEQRQIWQRIKAQLESSEL
ncbi:hypothetical protein HCN44_001051 [Aphidius gifuensis]|uniref:Uncharacterized protein n=1 Tax=Aphidius gifuensis TaxID=684658 RepID=A0A834XLH7_APHGI|nr:hypothetical protein HCN44_001051 [Aphidius gifuensis]